MRRTIVLTAGLSVFALWLSGCGYVAAATALAAVRSGGGGSTQQSQTTWTLTAAQDAKATSAGGVATDDPHAPSIDSESSSIGCVTIQHRTTSGEFLDAGCGALNVEVHPLLAEARVWGTIPSRAMDAKSGADLGASSITIDVLLTGDGPYRPEPTYAALVPLPRPDDPMRQPT